MSAADDAATAVVERHDRLTRWMAAHKGADWEDQILAVHHITVDVPLAVDVVSSDGYLILPATEKPFTSTPVVLDVPPVQMSMNPWFCTANSEDFATEGSNSIATTEACKLGCSEHRHTLPDSNLIYAGTLARCRGCDQWLRQEWGYAHIAYISGWYPVRRSQRRLRRAIASAQTQVARTVRYRHAVPVMHPSIPGVDPSEWELTPCGRAYVTPAKRS